MAPEFDVTLSPRAWRKPDARSPEPGVAFVASKRAFWKRNLGWGQDLIRIHESLDLVPLSFEVAKRVEATSTVSRPHREGHPNDDYNTNIVDQMEQKTPQFNLRNVERYILEGETDEIEWGKQDMPDRKAYNKDLAEVRAAKHVPPELSMDELVGGVVYGAKRDNDAVLYENDWEQWLGKEHKSTASGRLWEFVPKDGGKRTRPWPALRITAHKFWKGRLITEKY